MDKSLSLSIINYLLKPNYYGFVRTQRSRKGILKHSKVFSGFIIPSLPVRNQYNRRAGSCGGDRSGLVLCILERKRISSNLTFHQELPLWSYPEPVLTISGASGSTIPIPEYGFSQRIRNPNRIPRKINLSTKNCNPWSTGH